MQKTDWQSTRIHSFSYLFYILSRKIEKQAREKFSTLGVELSSVWILKALIEEDGVNQRHLCDKVRFPGYFTSRNINSLVKTGLVERRPDPKSGRSVLVCLTEEGQAKAKSLAGMIQSLNESMLENLSPDEQKQLIHLLQKIADIDEES